MGSRHSDRGARSIVCPSGERSEEESQAVLVRRHCTSRVGCPARCRGGSRTAPTRSHRHFRPRIGVRGRRRAGIQGRGVGAGGGLGFFTAFRMTGTRDHSCGRRPSQRAGIQAWGAIPSAYRPSSGASEEDPRRCSSAAIAHPESVAQRDVGAVREPPLRGPIVISATERASKGAEGFVRARRTPRPLPAS